MENGKELEYDYIIHFDPFSGTPLPSDDDDSWPIDSALLSKVATSLAGIKNLEKVKQILGKPDYEVGEGVYFKGELLYLSMSKTTTIVIQKIAEDDAVQVGAFGKEKTKAQDTKAADSKESK